MTQIPSSLPASAAQSAVQANEAAKEREARRTGQTEAARRQIKTVDEAGTTVDTDDADVAVFADAEGAGGQGRESQEHEAPPETEPNATDSGGIRRDEDGRLHVDMEA